MSAPGTHMFGPPAGSPAGSPAASAAPSSKPPQPSGPSRSRRALPAYDPQFRDGARNTLLMRALLYPSVDVYYDRIFHWLPEAKRAGHLRLANRNGRSPLVLAVLMAARSGDSQRRLAVLEAVVDAMQPGGAEAREAKAALQLAGTLSAITYERRVQIWVVLGRTRLALRVALLLAARTARAELSPGTELPRSSLVLLLPWLPGAPLRRVVEFL